MANDDDDPWLLREDGSLKVDAEARHIVYHSSLNVIVVLSQQNEVKVLDIISGVVLQSFQLPVVGKFFLEEEEEDEYGLENRIFAKQIFDHNIVRSIE